ncbi:EamA family transporter RarD [Pseudomarimonas salicorniae]|uniref:EamA family transporter RarD n=1 Tax=Pseudomarimonas salicorniae TaxID=2933270 RepID=A0ABT0GLT2_9GAMM|nr:EamA family transporter RarD [Lysobacter sp. CAU 1642]MCK7595471.1 EamA family transporter RarD [Lysobacter sp. CAU 1642]
MTDTSPDRRGLLAALSAYALWGVFPLYWALLASVPSLQIIAHRVVWCVVFVLVYLAVRGMLPALREAFGNPRLLRLLLLSAGLIGLNWAVYIWAVTHGEVVEASLGYFINPLVSVVLAVLVVGERLRRVQWAAVGLAALGVLWLSTRHEGVPWIALVLAVTFGFYGLVRRYAVIDAIPGLAVENLVLLPLALGWLVWSELAGSAAFLHQPGWKDLLLVFGGALTALPLIGFAYGARRIPLSLIGLLQYLAPTLQLICGVLLLGEPFVAEQAMGFGMIWAALAIYAADGWRRARRRVPAAA